MISTATRNTATVSPLSPLTNGNAVAQSANSGFAAALRKLAKQAEDPRGELPFILCVRQDTLTHTPEWGSGVCCFDHNAMVSCSFWCLNLDTCDETQKHKWVEQWVEEQ